MNLHEQLGALEAGVEQLIQAVVAQQAPAAHAAPPSSNAAAPADLSRPAAAPPAQAADDAVRPAAHPNDANDAPAAARVRTPVADAPAAETPGACAADTDAAIAADTAGPAATDARTGHGHTPPAGPLTLSVGRPSQNEITMTIAGNTVSLRPEQIGQLIEELSNARASMQPEPPASVPPGWRFAATRNPMMAVQKQSNGDRLLLLRHTGHGWVPFALSPDVAIQMYMLLTQR
jgi:hypothetical protein